MKTISTELVPKPEYHVRRRKYDGVVWLIANNYFYELDELADSIWLECDGRHTLEQIAQGLLSARQLPLDMALSATIMAVESFHSSGLIKYASNDS